ncbi:MAG: phenylalanine--tRNA ligase subunit beta [Burkholderiales bacterium]|nr:phenylalanine--tRNA ligase subunit beta [Burkholderiales bacterium]
MLISEEWLRSYINPPLDSDALCEKMTMGGLEVETSEPVAPKFDGVVVSQIIDVRDHPNATKLHICTVNVGKSEPLMIVCGAPNAVAGAKVPCALVGATLPGGMKITRAKLRGVESNGMLCSSRELGVNEDHSGLWILPENAPIGENIRIYERLDDRKIDVKLTPNRGDALSVIGLGRDLRALTGAPLRMPDFSPVAPTSDVTHPLHIEAPDLCGRFAGRVVRGLNASAPTPQWMKDRLERSGQRSISALVDISNYVMLELGRPSHIFDLDKLKGDLVVRWGKDGEKATLLNGKTVDITPYFGVIVDDNGVEALAGIMGGEHAAVRRDTKIFFKEGAFWWPNDIQGRSRELGFTTDAAYRFERGVDIASNVDHLEYITRLIVDICGTADTEVGPVVDQIIKLPERKPVVMRIDRCRKVIGVDIPEDKMAECFTNLGFSFVKEDGKFIIDPPPYRFDIEIEEDLIEEVARLVGYEILPDNPPIAPDTMMEHDESRRERHDLTIRIEDMGFQELINYSFIEHAAEKDFSGNDDSIKVLNPIAAQMDVMRTQLMAGLVENLRFNLNRKAERVLTFEMGRIFKHNPEIEGSESEVKGVEQPVHLAALMYGSAFPVQWGIKPKAADFFDMKGVVEELAAPLKLKFKPTKHPALHPGRTATIVLDGEEIGIIGELHPKLMKHYELQKAPILFEIDVEKLLEVGIPEAQAVSKYQPIFRDIAIWVDENVPLQQIMDAVKKARKKDLRLFPMTSFELFDVYRPTEGEEKGKKSFAFSLTLQGQDKPLEEAEVDEAMGALLEVLSKNGAELRH